MKQKKTRRRIITLSTIAIIIIGISLYSYFTSSAVVHRELALLVIQVEHSDYITGAVFSTHKRLPDTGLNIKLVAGLSDEQIQTLGKELMESITGIFIMAWTKPYAVASMSDVLQCFLNPEMTEVEASGQSVHALLSLQVIIQTMFCGVFFNPTEGTILKKSAPMSIHCRLIGLIKCTENISSGTAEMTSRY